MRHSRMNTSDMGAYIGGSVVRAAVHSPQYPAHDKGRPQKQPQKEFQKEIKNETKQKVGVITSLQLGLPYLVLFCSLAIMVMVCIGFIKMKSDINVISKSLETKEQLLQELQDSNKALEASINTSIDLDEIELIATRDYGMVHANKNQIVTYKKSESEYVRQYDDIPIGR